MKNHSHMPALLAAFLIFCLAAGVPPVVSSEPEGHIVILVSPTSAARTFAKRLWESLQQVLPGHRIRMIEPPQQQNAPPGALFLLLGSSALDRYAELAREGKPANAALALLITRRHFEKIWKQGGAALRERLSAIFLDQPPSRQFLLAAYAFPERKRIGVLLSPATRPTLPILRKLADRMNRRLVRMEIDSGKRLFPRMERLFERSDVFLALPDPAVVNRTTLQPLLLTSYRYRIPVVAFSRAYVKAGATAAIYTPLEGLAEETAEILQAYFERDEETLPPPHYSGRFRILLNRQVARSLGIRLPSEASLEAAIRDWEAKNR